ncbi:MAG: hypothetical protein HYW93_07280, partial [Thaumarchaeota archaeon]|nr:hypothetical protein [Nitrososphaerota archaeon]
MARALVFSIVILALLVIAPARDEAVGAPPAASLAEDNTPHLIVSVSPSTLPADGGSYKAIYVEIQTAKGLPLAAPQNITLTLTSSVLQVGSVDPTAQLSEGETYSVATFHTTLTPGSTNITATAKGMKAASVKVTTVSPSGSAVKLGVFASPATLLPQVGSTGKILVQLLDAGNRPARAPSAISVSLASSSPSVADVTPRITIQKGQTYGTAVTTAAYVAGSTTITASASGLATGTTSLSVEGQNPSKLFVRVAPEVLAPAGEFAILVVQLQSQDGTPTPAPANITVTVTSSNTTVGTVTTPALTIQVGKTFASGSFLPFKTGTSILTATAQSYASGFFNVRVVKAGDTTKGGVLALISALPVVLSDNEAYPV